MADRQTHAHAIGFTGVEGLKQFRLLGLRQAGALVGDFDPDLIIAAPARHINDALRLFAHGFRGVADEIKQYLLDVDPLQ